MEDRKLMELYYNMILMKPEYPQIVKGDCVLNKDKNYVPYESIFGGTSGAGYDIYIGKVDVNELLDITQIADEYKGKRETYLCKFKADKKGYYKRNSFYISPLIFAIAKMNKEKNEFCDIDINAINKANDEFNDFLLLLDRKLEAKELSEVFNYVVNKLNLSILNLEFNGVIKEANLFLHSEDDGILLEIEKLLSRRQQSEKVSNLLTFKTTLADKKRKQNTIEKDSIIKLSHPDMNSVGMWPNLDSLNLREQVALNELIGRKKEKLEKVDIVTSNESIEKIALEYIVANTIERAMILSSYEDPDDAFREIDFEENRLYSSTFYEIDERIANKNLVVCDSKNEFFKFLNKKVIGEFEKNNKYKKLLQEVFNIGKLPYIFEKLNSNFDVLNLVNETWKGKEGLKIQLFEIK